MKIEMFDSLLDLGCHALGSEGPIDLLNALKGYERGQHKLLQIRVRDLLDCSQQEFATELRFGLGGR